MHAEKGVACSLAPLLAGWSASAATEAVARAGSRYGPVHVSSVQGRPVVTLSGPPVHHHVEYQNNDIDDHHHHHVGAVAINGPPAPIAVVRGPSGIITAGASASAHASAHANSDWATRKYWYPSPTWRKC